MHKDYLSYRGYYGHDRTEITMSMITTMTKVTSMIILTKMLGWHLTKTRVYESVHSNTMMNPLAKVSRTSNLRTLPAICSLLN